MVERETMKTVLALLLAFATLATAQVRRDPPKEVSLRNVRVTSKEFKEAFKNILQKMNSFTGDVDMDAVHRERMARVTKDNPHGNPITEKSLVERLKKGEKFEVMVTGERVPCTECQGKDPKECKRCLGKGKLLPIQTVTYVW